MSANTPRVSVVLPIHDAGGYLERTRRQLGALKRDITYEFVLIDDHSTDDSLNTIKSWSDELPGSIRVLKAEKRGVANARNQALNECRGEFVWLTDADDEWYPEIVSDLVRAIEAAGAELAVCNAVKRSQAGADVGMIEDAPKSETTTGREAFVRLLNGDLQGHLWNKLFRRSALENNPFPVTRAHSDLGGMLRLLPTLDTVAYLPHTLYVYVQNPGSILNHHDYRIDDLESCLNLATTEVASFPDDSAKAPLTLFKYRNVVLPSLNEIARRRRLADVTERRSSAARVRATIRWSELFSLARQRAPLTMVAQGVVARLSTTAYVTAYAALRRAPALSGRPADR